MINTRYFRVQLNGTSLANVATQGLLEPKHAWQYDNYEYNVTVPNNANAIAKARARYRWVTLLPGLLGETRNPVHLEVLANDSDAVGTATDCQNETQYIEFSVGYEVQDEGTVSADNPTDLFTYSSTTEGDATDGDLITGRNAIQRMVARALAYEQQPSWLQVYDETHYTQVITTTGQEDPADSDIGVVKASEEHPLFGSLTKGTAYVNSPDAGGDVATRIGNIAPLVIVTEL